MNGKKKDFALFKVVRQGDFASGGREVARKRKEIVA